MPLLSPIIGEAISAADAGDTLNCQEVAGLGFHCPDRSGICLAAPSKGSDGGSLSEDEAATLAAGKALAEKGAYDEAVAYFRDRLSSAEIGRSERASILHMLGYLLLYAERVEEAMENTQAAHNWALKQRLSAEAGSFSTELALQQAFAQAVKLRSSGNISGSNSKFEEADRLARAINSPPYQLKISGTWSLNYVSSSDGQAKYLALSLRTLELAKLLNYKLEASRAEKRVGAFYAMKSDYSRALSYYLKALNYLGTGREGQDVIKCMNNIAGMYLSLGDYVKAKDYLLDAASRVTAGSTGAFETSILVNLGTLFGVMGKRLQLVDFQKKALDCFASYLNLKSVQGGGSLRLEALAGMAGVIWTKAAWKRRGESSSPPSRRPGNRKALPWRPGKSSPIWGRRRFGPAPYPRPRGISRKRVPYPDRPTVRS